MSRSVVRRQTLVARTLRELDSRLRAGPAALARGFAAAYLAAVPLEDLQSQSPRVLAAGLLDHLAFGMQRRPGQTLLRVVNLPTQDSKSQLQTAVQLVCDDMPFLVDTQVMTLDAAGLAVHGIAHPVLRVQRDARGRLRAVGADTPGGRSESWQYLLIDPIAEESARRSLERQMRSALADVRLACRDWPAMKKALRTAIDSLPVGKSRIPGAIVSESAAFLEWMLQDNFLFLGYRRSRLDGRANTPRLTTVRGSELGILRARRVVPATDVNAPRVRAADLQREARARSVLVVTKGAQTSTVHRPGPLDYVGIKCFDERGQVVGESRFLGLWTSSAYRCSPFEIPLLRQRLTQVRARFSLAPDSHDGKRLQQILETWPRDELLQASEEELAAAAAQVLGLQERRRVLVVLRRERFRRFVSALVFVPRERYDEALLARIEELTCAACRGYSVSAEVGMFDPTVVRVQLLVRVDPAARDRDIDSQSLQQAITRAAERWQDALREALVATGNDAARAALLSQRYSRVLPPAYQDETSPADALADIVDLEVLRDRSGPRFRLVREADDALGRVHLRRVARGEIVPMSDVLPLLENFGLRVIAERAQELHLDTGEAAAIQDITLQSLNPPLTPDRARQDAGLLDALQRTLAGEAENDGFNRLVLAAQFNVRQVMLLRALCRYLLQTGLPTSQPTMQRVLAEHGRTANMLFQLFELRLDPSYPAALQHRRQPSLERSIRRSLDAVASLEEDRILRGLLDVTLAITRTSYYRASVPLPDTLAFKFDPRLLPQLPRPVPRFEIFVHGLHVEGVHLRMGAVARGGLRWSDRPYDFRTEILGLMKTQHVKNSLIVPVGAKGGFIVRRMPASRESQSAELTACYRQYIHALLDLTDNIVDSALRPPDKVRRHDADDPYLVVAADKGTATFSDTANEIALQRGYWLGDAFASGGSAGYDHKAIGITARGAWECVKRHFRELGTDIQREAFTVMGIGDMSGDVFGNGMLLSRQIRLQAAFNHQHIFLDPDPDPKRSFAERSRLFLMPRSGWNDYDRGSLSRGGGIFERNAKSVPISREVQQLLAPHLDGRSVATPPELIRAILRMRVDLLWNGGIGTYVKASAESHLDAGDRGNDALRVDGRELRARVVGEGGNLGFTQLGRVEYALAGGRLNTDSIDNSAGVNTSDVEVNYKILLGTRPSAARNRLLHRVTGDVAAHVLRNNFLQGQALSLMQREALARVGDYQALIRALVRGEGLDPELERLPKDDELTERARRGQGLCRPELAVLLSWQKLALNRELLDSDLPEDPYFAAELERYFAPAIRQRHGRAIARHPLRREIIATTVSNSVINRMGATFLTLMQESTGARAPQIARAYTIVREVLDLRQLWSDIETLDHRVPADAQYLAMAETIALSRHLCRWLLQQHRARLSVAGRVRELATPLRLLQAQLPQWLQGEEHLELQRRCARLSAAGLPEALAQRVAALDALRPAFDLVSLSQERRVAVARAAQMHAEVGAALGVDWLRHRAQALEGTGGWHFAARDALVEGSWHLQCRLADAALRARIRHVRQLPQALTGGATALASWQALLAQLRAAPALDLAALSVGFETLSRLAGR